MHRGSSLTGLLAGTAVAAMLAVAAGPQLAAPDPSKAAASAQQIVADLRAAQRLAVSQRSSYLVEFAPVPGPYSRYVLRAEDAAEDHVSRTFPPRVVASGPPQVIFRPNGTTVGGTITVSARGATVVIHVSPISGRIAAGSP